VLFAEHVIEHFEPTQVSRIASLAFSFLKKRGRIRVAVPDGFKPSPSYQKYIRPGGTNSGSGQHHMVAWTIENLPPLFESAGFEISPVEYFDASGKFHSAKDAYDGDRSYGKVRRSWKHDGRNVKPYVDHSYNWGKLSTTDLAADEPLFTSLWFDAIKPQSCDAILNLS